MTDLDDPIENRLRADADAAARRAPDLPSLNAALASFDGRRRRRAPVWLAAAAAVLAVAGLAVFLATNAAGRHHSPPAESHAPTPAPTPTLPHEIRDPLSGRLETLRHVVNASNQGVVQVAGDPRSYDVYVPGVAHGTAKVNGKGKAHPFTDYLCAVISPQVTVVEQNATTVRITVSGYQYVRNSIKHRTQAYGCSTGAAQRVRIRLDQPLGNRALYTIKGGRPAVVLDPSDQPKIGDLPAGFRLLDSGTGQDRRQTLAYYLEYVLSSDPKCQDLGCGSFLSLTTVPRSTRDVFAEFPPVHRTTVNGYPATLIYIAGPKIPAFIACVTWHEAPSEHGRQLCFNGKARDHFTTSELLAIARSVH